MPDRREPPRGILRRATVRRALGALVLLAAFAAGAGAPILRGSIAACGGCGGSLCCNRPARDGECRIGRGCCDSAATHASLGGGTWKAELLPPPACAVPVSPAVRVRDPLAVNHRSRLAAPPDPPPRLPAA